MSAAAPKTVAAPFSAEEWGRLERAQAALASRLKRLFGQNLRGVNGFGARVDQQNSELGLQVTVEDMQSVAKARKLGPTIEGLPVTVEVGEAAAAD